MTTTTPTPPRHAGGEIDRERPEGGDDGDAPLFLRLTARNRHVVVVVDPAVDPETLAVARGPHHSYRDGEALVISAAQPAGGPAEVISRLFVGTPRRKPELQVRVHPGTPIEFLARKSTLDVAGDAAVTGRAVGCNATIATASGPVDLDLVATTAKIISPMRRGDSQIRLKVSTASIDLAGGTVLLEVTSRRTYRSRVGHKGSHQPAPGVDVAGPLACVAGGYLLGDLTDHTAATAPRLGLRLSAGAAYLDARP